MTAIETILRRPASAWSADDISGLLAAPEEDHETILQAASEKRAARHGNRVTYVQNRNVNFSNICTVRCLFCAFYRGPRHEEAFRMTVEEVIEAVSDTPWITEVCLQGAIDPNLHFDYYTGLLRALHDWKPSVHLHAFSPQEIWSLSKNDGKPVEAVLGELRDAGLGSLPGTAAEILEDGVRHEIAPRRVTVRQWEEVITKAHKMGLRSSATVMCGHVETNTDMAVHLATLRRIQEETGGFTEFVILPFMGGNTALLRAGKVQDTPLNRAAIERLTAVSRLYFDDVIPNIQASWVKLGPEDAVEMVDAGANDLGGTLYEENITRSTGARSLTCLTSEDFHRLAKAKGLRAVERTTLYELRQDIN